MTCSTTKGQSMGSGSGFLLKKVTFPSLYAESKVSSMIRAQLGHRIRNCMLGRYHSWALGVFYVG